MITWCITWYHNFILLVHRFSTLSSDSSLFDTPPLLLFPSSTVLKSTLQPISYEIDLCCYGSDCVTKRNSCQLKISGSDYVMKRNSCQLKFSSLQPPLCEFVLVFNTSEVPDLETKIRQLDNPHYCLQQDILQIKQFQYRFLQNIKLNEDTVPQIKIFSHFLFKFFRFNYQVLW